MTRANPSGPMAQGKVAMAILLAVGVVFWLIVDPAEQLNPVPLSDPRAFAAATEA